MRIRIQLFTLMRIRIRIQLITDRNQILPFNLMRILIHSTASKHQKRILFLRETPKAPENKFNFLKHDLSFCRPFKHSWMLNLVWESRSVSAGPVESETNPIIPISAKQNFLQLRYSKLFHLPPLRLHCVGGNRDWTWDCSKFALSNRCSNQSARSHRIRKTGWAWNSIYVTKWDSCYGNH